LVETKNYDHLDLEGLDTDLRQAVHKIISEIEKVYPNDNALSDPEFILGLVVNYIMGEGEIMNHLDQSQKKTRKKLLQSLPNRGSEKMVGWILERYFVDPGDQ